MPSIWGTTRYSSFDLKIWPCGTPFLTLALTMKVMSDWPSKLFSWVADYMLYSHQVRSSFDQNYSKNKVFVSIMIWPNFDLDLWPWPLSFGVMVINTLIHLYENNTVPSTKNKEVEKIQFWHFDVTKWRHNVKLFVDLENTHQDLSWYGTVWYLQFQIVTFG
jgi:hypothetical protein